MVLMQQMQLLMQLLMQLMLMMMRKSHTTIRCNASSAVFHDSACDCHMALHLGATCNCHLALLTLVRQPQPPEMTEVQHHQLSAYLTLSWRGAARRPS
jgi:hypothetical protein